MAGGPPGERGVLVPFHLGHRHRAPWVSNPTGTPLRAPVYSKTRDAPVLWGFEEKISPMSVRAPVFLFNPRMC